MSSLQRLHREWVSLRDSFDGQIGRLEAGETIYADSQYATNAWRNKLGGWRGELDDLIAQYPPTNLEVDLLYLEQRLARRQTT